jgi:hypothetical protein
MKRMFLLNVVLLCSSLSLLGMSSIEIFEPDMIAIDIPDDVLIRQQNFEIVCHHTNQLFNRYFGSSAAIQAPVMTLLVTLPRAMMYIPFKEALVHACAAGAASGIVNMQIALIGCFIYALLDRAYLPNLLRPRTSASLCLAALVTYLAFDASGVLLREVS